MADQELIQFHADKKLKQRVMKICEDIGTDLPTVFRMCMMQMEIINGIPFPVEKSVSRSQAKQAIQRMREQAAERSEISLDEINSEISASRRERKLKKERRP
ncbi:MAG: type II toxin-antitoxin system RelB/DinJ family antitoxin [Lachnospiraceae bacterium]|nr:type II toxin-antitoxin system RelB/DinJ family antitoxin [Lachnospiraceae bacterium]